MKEAITIGRFELFKCEAQKILCHWLEVALPSLNINENWKKYIEDKVSKAQLKTIKNLSYSKIRDLDFAMLLNIISNNWWFLRDGQTNLTGDHKTYVDEMRNARNRWSHISTLNIENHPPHGIKNRDIARDSDTIKRFIEVLIDSHPILDRIDEFVYELHGVSNPPIISDPPEPYLGPTRTPPNNVDGNGNDEKIGVLVKRHANKILDFAISSGDIEKLKNKEQSKRMFKLSFAFCIEVDENYHPQNDKVERYWKDPFVVSGRWFVITSEWYKKNKPILLDWLKDNKLFSNPTSPKQ